MIPPVPDKPRTKPGDIWILGDHVVGCGDGRDREFLDKVVGKGAQVDAAFLDPPYELRISGHVNAKERHGEFAMASGEMTDEAFPSLLDRDAGACRRGLARRRGPLRLHGLAPHERRLRCRPADLWRSPEPLHLEQEQAGMGSLYRSKHELVFVYRVGSAPHFNAVELGRHGRNRTNVWDYASVNSLRGQPPRRPRRSIRQ